MRRRPSGRRGGLPLGAPVGVGKGAVQQGDRGRLANVLSLNNIAALTFVVALVSMLITHNIADHWAQTHIQVGVLIGGVSLWSSSRCSEGFLRVGW
ncbi:hypothetical protein [Actinomadura coerulea]|uniref:hypothetical protein n=1 Tax=Actinomadura coerulea TaxID=46159 RepID=UPI0034374DB2